MRTGARRWPAAALLLVTLAPAARPVPAQDAGIAARYQRGAEALTRGDLPTALETLGSVAAENASFQNVQILLGQACLAAGLRDAAKDHFDRAVSQDPNRDSRPSCWDSRSIRRRGTTRPSWRSTAPARSLQRTPIPWSIAVSPNSSSVAHRRPRRIFVPRSRSRPMTTMRRSASPSSSSRAETGAPPRSGCGAC